MIRSLQCQMTNDQGGITLLPTHICEHYEIVKPPTKGVCNFDVPCAGEYRISSLYQNLGHVSTSWLCFYYNGIAGLV